MSDKSVYLAGPIAGLTFDDADAWRVHARDALRRHDIDGMSPLRGKAYLRALGNLTMTCQQEGQAGILSAPRSIMTRDFYDATRCDVLLVNLLNAQRISIGTMMEVAWCFQKRTPIVCCMEPGEISSMSLEDRVWLAAMVDGEGHIGINATSRTNKGVLKNVSYQNRVKISMTSKEILDKVCKITGFGRVLPAAHRGAKRKQMYDWKCVGLEAKIVLQQIYPHLIAKRDQAALALEMAAIKTDKWQRTKGRSGFQVKDAATVTRELSVFLKYREAMKGKRVPYTEPSLPAFANPHEHAMLAQAIDFRVPTLDEALALCVAILRPNPPDTEIKTLV